MAPNDKIQKLIHGHLNGSASYVDLEFHQNAIIKTNGPNTGGFHSTGPDGGRTLGDLRITLEYTGGKSFVPVSYETWSPTSENSYNYIPYPGHPDPVHAAANGFKILVPYSAFDNTSYPPLQYVEGAIDLIALIGGNDLRDESVSLPFKTLFIQSKSSPSTTYFSQLDEDEKKFTIFSETLFELNESQPSLNESNAIVLNIDDEVKKYFKKYPHKLYDLNPRKFEELIASILKDLGFDVELTKATRDGGRDIIASIRNAVTSFLAYVECKRFAADNKVGVGIIRKVAGVHYMKMPSKSIIVTTSFFTKDAVIEAKLLENQLELKDFNDIKVWLRNY